jgi:hypothetical protein
MREGVPKSLQAGNVPCYEPLLTAGNQAFFVEDTSRIVPAGYEILNCRIRQRKSNRQLHPTDISRRPFLE